MSACSDIAFSGVLSIVKNILGLIQILGPIICLISLTITFIKIISNPDDKKLTGKIKNIIIALIVLFFIPMLVNVVMNLIGESSKLSDCWNNISSIDVTGGTFIPIDSKKKKSIYMDPSDYQKGEKDTSSSSTAGDSSSSGDSSKSSDSALVVKEETDSLKLYIYKVNTYYITQIWVKNAYEQLNKYDSPEYGSKLYKPSSLLEKAINSKGLSQKLIVGFNASGFYLKDVYDASSVKSYPAYDKTSVGSLVITDGKVVRNAYDHAVKTWYIVGVDQSNTLRIFEDASSKDLSSKKNWSESVIGKVRNTFTFASPLVMNGSASNIKTSMPSPGSSLNRQAICQIDNNNFILITGKNLSRQDLIDIMLKAKCKTGTNFDGGGSIALIYKGKNSNKIETIIGNNRALSEVGYFVEG